jgi:lycopene beta-cyclase
VIAAALAQEGLRVVVVAPRPTARWNNVYATWLDELEACDRSGWVQACWQRPLVRLGDDRAFDLRRPYARIDAARMQDDLRGELLAAGGELLAGRAAAVEHGRDGSAVVFSSGARIATRIVVDASGGAGAFVARGRGAPAYQSAYGELLRLRRSAGDAGEMAFMDWRGGDDPPSFLYTMPLDDGLFFAEETSLVRRPALGHGLLRERLHARLGRMGLHGAEVVSREACLIAMGVGLPRRQRTIAYGAAGAFVHPATGYQLARALRLARPTARAIAVALRHGGAAAASRAAYRVTWPAAARLSWRLYALGMEALAAFDARTMRAFMAAFFSLPDARWRGFLDGTLSPAALVSAMARIFAAADGKVRRRLLAAPYTAAPAALPAREVS